MLNEKSLAGQAVVIGAGTMGGGIAAQLANVGWQVSLLDVAGLEGRNRNRAAQTGLERLQNNRPPLLFLPEYAGLIRVGNLDDNADWLQDADWIVEAVAENMAVKQEVMGLIDAQIGPRLDAAERELVISSNTSGLSLREMSRNCRETVRRHFLGTHFLNPPRYLKLLEVIPLPETHSDFLAGVVRFAEQVLGHRVALAKDTPGFISTRLWITHLLDTIHTTAELGLTVEEADTLTGAFLGRPKSATFRMADLVGLDIVAAIARNQYLALPDDPLRERLLLPEAVQRLISEDRLGEKSGGGFYKREGKAILALDLATGEYRQAQTVRDETIEAWQRLPLPERLHAVQAAVESPEDGGKHAVFLKRILTTLFSYVRAVGTEIAADSLTIDNVMEWGFGWQSGPCAMADAFFSQEEYYRDTESGRLLRILSSRGKTPAAVETGSPSDAWLPMPATPEYITLDELRAAGNTVLESPVGALLDLGDSVACLEFRTKMNTLNPALCDFIDMARERAERDFAGLVIGNQGAHFSAGYDLKLLLDAIQSKDWNRVDALMKQVQEVFRRLKYASLPMTAAPHGYTLGGGWECVLHCAAIQAAPELSAGLPETSSGLVPTGGGMTALLARADTFLLVEQAFDLLVFPTPTNNAHEARKRGLLRPTDGISRSADRLLFDAKQRVLELANAGYAPPVEKTVAVLGEDALARLQMKIHNLYRAGVYTEHDRFIADRVAFFLSGGNLPFAQEVRETYLLALERRVFLELAQTQKTAERIQHLLETGKPLKN